MFSGIAIHTDNVPRLVEFYTKVLGFTAEGDDVHSVIGESQLAIWNPGNIDDTQKAGQGNFTLMYQVEDADVEYERIKTDIPAIEIIFEPVVQPWGVKAFGIKDPDGNLLNFLSQAD